MRAEAQSTAGAPGGERANGRRLFRVAACVLAGAMLAACASKTDEIVEPLWYYRMQRPPSPWVPGQGESTFAGIGLKGDHFFHNPFTGGVMVIRAFPLSFRYRDFGLSDHARRIYREILEGWGNNMRTIKGGRFLPLEEAWSVQTQDGRQRLEFQLRGSLARPVIDEAEERRRIEQEIISGEDEERFGPETREMRKRRIDWEKSRTQMTRGARGKFVLILVRGRLADILYEFAILDHELAFSRTVRTFDRVVASFELLK